MGTTRQPTGPDTADSTQPPRPLRRSLGALALQNALDKRAAGVPTYTVAEAAALLSVSPEHLYRLVHAGTFPAVHLHAGGHGRYVVPANTVEKVLDDPGFLADPGS